MNVIAGLEGNRRAVIETARRIGTAIMISANSYWLGARFSDSWKALAGLKIHLDSGGYVAMKRYGGFRFSVEQYAALAAELRPVWWAQMDQCCEPEIATNREEVFKRIDRTAANLQECRRVAASLGTKAPMMVLQGWMPDDYITGPAFDDPGFEWPEMVGVGSVCRRRIHGPDGLLAVIGKLDANLPEHIRFHLFGVKSAAAERLKNHPRLASVDSMAWAYRARKASRERSTPCSNLVRASFFESWVEKQRKRVCQSNETKDLFSKC